MRRMGIGVVLLLSACATVRYGRDFDAKKAQGFVEGKTTKAEVLAALGEPYQKAREPGGAEGWTYMYTTTTASVDPATLFVPFYTGMNMSDSQKWLHLTFNGEVVAEMRWSIPAQPPVPEKDEPSEIRQKHPAPGERLPSRE